MNFGMEREREREREMDNLREEQKRRVTKKREINGRLMVFRDQIGQF